MLIDFIVEEPSLAHALEKIIPAIVGEASVEWNILVHQGKTDLLQKLPGRLAGYKHIFTYDPDRRVFILIDEDREDCKALKAELEKMAAEAGLRTRTTSPTQFQVVNRIVIEELEAWFFGDTEALVKAYPRVPSTLHEQARYRDPDGITGGTWEALQRVLQEHGYHRGGLEKLRAAGDIAQHMQPDRNRSKSFQVFRDTLREMCK